MAVDIGQPVVPALVEVGQPLVVDAHQVKDGGVEVVDVHAVADDVVAPVVGFAVPVSAPGS